MSAPIKRYDLVTKHKSSMMTRVDDGDFMLHADHLAAMAAESAYDDEKERELCHQFMQDNACSGPYSYEDMWLACAKSRAKAAGCL